MRAGTSRDLCQNQVEPGRFVVEAAPLPELPDWLQLAAGGGVGAGARFAVVEGGLGIGLELATLLEAAGADVRILAPDEVELAGHIAGGAGADGLLWVASADADADTGSPATLPAAFPALRAAILGGTRRLLVVTGCGAGAEAVSEASIVGRDGGRGAERRMPPGDRDDRDTVLLAMRDDPRPVAVGVDRLPGIGFAGFVRAVAREVPEVSARLVDVDPKEAPTRVAEHLLAELFSPGGPPVVGYRAGRRSAPVVVAAELDRATPPLPAGLGPSSVVLFTGGARGITARVAVELARRTGCTVELVGRTPLPSGPGDSATAGAADAPALRRALVAAGVRRPADVEARLAAVLAEREVRATLAELTASASSVRYHAVDVRDAGAVRRVLDGVYARHGRLDGVVHGAGVLEDKLLRDKTPESFTRVYATKVDGARALLDALRPDVGFVAFFGSVAGVFGNRGQADYAAANDALDALARHATRRFAGRVVSIDWGPWGTGTGTGAATAATSAVGANGSGIAVGGRGMVSAELERAYARRGIGLIDPAGGVTALLRELAAGRGAPAQVVYMCGSVEAFGG